MLFKSLHLQLDVPDHNGVGVCGYRGPSSEDRNGTECNMSWEGPLRLCHWSSIGLVWWSLDLPPPGAGSENMVLTSLSLLGPFLPRLCILYKDYCH